MVAYVSTTNERAAPQDLATHEDLVARVAELEARSAFQEDAIQALSETLATLNRTVHELEVANRYLAGKLREVSDGGASGESQFEVPPHY